MGVIFRFFLISVLFYGLPAAVVGAIILGTDRFIPGFVDAMGMWILVPFTMLYLAVTSLVGHITRDWDLWRD